MTYTSSDERTTRNTRAPARDSLSRVPYTQMLRNFNLAKGDIARARRMAGHRILVRCNVEMARENWRRFRYWRRVLRAIEAGNIAQALEVLAEPTPAPSLLRLLP